MCPRAKHRRSKAKFNILIFDWACSFVYLTCSGCPHNCYAHPIGPATHCGRASVGGRGIALRRAPVVSASTGSRASSPKKFYCIAGSTEHVGCCRPTLVECSQVRHCSRREHASLGPIPPRPAWRTAQPDGSGPAGHAETAASLPCPPRPGRALCGKAGHRAAGVAVVSLEHCYQAVPLGALTKCVVLAHQTAVGAMACFDAVDVSTRSRSTLR